MNETQRTSFRKTGRATAQATTVITPEVISIRTARNTDAQLLLVNDCPVCHQVHRHILPGTRFAGCGARYELVVP